MPAPASSCAPGSERTASVTSERRRGPPDCDDVDIPGTAGAPSRPPFCLRLLSALLGQYQLAAHGEFALDGCSAGSRLPATDGHAVLAGGDHAVPGGVDQAHITRAQNETNMLALRGRNVDARKAAQGAQRRSLDGGKTQIELHHLIGGERARVANLRLYGKRVAGV